MKLLFEQGTPAASRGRLPADTVNTLAEKGWLDKDNGELLDALAADDARTTTMCHPPKEKNPQ